MQTLPLLVAGPSHAGPMAYNYVVQKFQRASDTRATVILARVSLEPARTVLATSIVALTDAGQSPEGAGHR